MKKTLLSIALVGFAFVASSQTTIFKDYFNSHTVGNLSTGFDPMTEGQGGWYTETLYSGDNAATQIVSVGANNNALQITGFNGPSTTSGPSANRTVFRSLQSVWASRPANQDVIYVSYKMIVPGLSGSKNTFSAYLLNSTGDRLLGVRFNPNTRVADGFAYVKYPDGTYNTRTLVLGFDAATNYNLTFSDDPETIEVLMAYNKVTGVYQIQVSNSDQSVYGSDEFTTSATNEALVGVDPAEFMIVAGAGGLTNSESESVSFDNIHILAQSCIAPNNSDFSYGTASACVGSSNLSPTFLAVENEAAGSYTVTPNSGLSINASGVIDMTLSQPGTYNVKYTSVATNLVISPTYSVPLCSDFHIEQIVIKESVTPSFSSVAVCLGSTPSIPTTSTNGITGTWSPVFAAITANQNYTFTADANQCVTSPTVNFTVTIATPVTPEFSPVSVCSGATPSIPTTSTNGITGLWSPSFAAITANQNYTFTADANQCVTSPTVNFTVTIGSPVTPMFNTPAAICSGTVSSLPLTSTNSVTGTWSPAFAAITAPTEYTFTATTPGCFATGVRVTVPVNSLPTATITSNSSTTFCQGSSVILTSSTGNSYEWKRDATVLASSNTNTHTAYDSGSYTVKVTDANGCSKVSLPTVLTANSKVTPTFTLSDNIVKGSTAIALPTSSTNVPPITGTLSKGSSSAIVSSITSSTLGAIIYTFTPASSFCATPYTKSINCVVGIEEATISSFTIYPNPSNDVISVSFSELASRTGTIKFIAPDGKLIESRDYNNSSVETFDVKSLNPGIYFLQIDNSIEKVVVQ
jgi:hypothetical protein